MTTHKFGLTLFKPSSKKIFLTERSKAVLLLRIIFVVYVPCLSCFIVYSLQPCGHMLGKANLLALMCVLFHCVFVTFPSGVVLRFLIFFPPCSL